MTVDTVSLTVILASLQVYVNACVCVCVCVCVTRDRIDSFIFLIAILTCKVCVSVCESTCVRECVCLSVFVLTIQKHGYKIIFWKNVCAQPPKTIVWVLTRERKRGKERKREWKERERERKKRDRKRGKERER